MNVFSNAIKLICLCENRRHTSNFKTLPDRPSSKIKNQENEYLILSMIGKNRKCSIKNEKIEIYCSPNTAEKL